MAKVLIIEDDQHVALSLRMGLETMHHEVVVAENGREGLAALKEVIVDLVITDIIMPEMDGIETILELKKSYPETKIIAISGGGRNQPHDYLRLAELLGASRVFVKPVDIEAIRDAIDQLVPGNID